MNLPISYKDDRRTAEQILLQAAEKHTVHIAEMAEPALDALKRRVHIRPGDLTPRVYYRFSCAPRHSMPKMTSQPAHLPHSIPESR